MISRKLTVAAMAALATSGAVIGLASPAAASHLSYVSLGTAGTVGNPTQTANYQMFGTVQCGTGTAARPVQHLSITGTLNGGPGTAPTASTTTSDAGVFRLTGNLGWAAIITGGGNVTMPLADGSTYTITLADFEAHRVGGLLGTSAGPFRIQLSDAYCGTLPNG